MTLPIVLVHGYSDRGQSWARWRAQLETRDRRVLTCTYQSLVNEVTIKDIAEAFDRALVAEGGLGPGEAFDAMVHSTGMLILRAWLVADPARVKRLKHLVALAPATFGSPLAKKGRSWLGAIFKGNRHLGPDFLDAGDLVLDGLELGSKFTWDLAQQDVLGNMPSYNAGPDTPYVSVFCGTGTYEGLQRIVDTPGTDGTVRRAGCSLDIRRISLDMTQKGMVMRQQGKKTRLLADTWQLVDMPVHLIGQPDGSDGVNHATILSDPADELIGLVEDALQVDNAEAHAAWLKAANAPGRMVRMPKQFQQFVVHAVDERGDPVTDYNVQLYLGDNSRVQQFDAEVDVYSGDASLRCFHVDITRILQQSGVAPDLTIHIIASTGTTYVGYLGYGFEDQDKLGASDATLQLTGDMLSQAAFFRPYTTTLIRLYIERQVLPPDPTKPATLLTWNLGMPGTDATGTLVAAAAGTALDRA
jgi:pimeloyl-ACP methyl ester carboxylesterase